MHVKHLHGQPERATWFNRRRPLRGHMRLESYTYIRFICRRGRFWEAEAYQQGYGAVNDPAKKTHCAESQIRIEEFGLAGHC